MLYVSIFLFSAFTLLVGQEEKAVSIEMLDTSIVLSVKYQSGVCLSVCPIIAAAQPQVCGQQIFYLFYLRAGTLVCKGSLLEQLA